MMEVTKSARRYHMCLNIAGFMRNNKFPDAYDCFENEDGSQMSPGAAFTFLNAEQAKGHKVIPCSSECGNPCQRSGCAGFDYKGGGCPGYLIDDMNKGVEQ